MKEVTRKPDPTRRSVRVDLRVVLDPDEKWGVLMQFEHGYIVMAPDSAHRLAHEVHELADEAHSRNPR